MTTPHWRSKKLSPSRDPERAHCFFVEKNELSFEEFEKQRKKDNEISMINVWFNEHALKKLPKRGDFVQLVWEKYRNDGLYIVDHDEYEQLYVRALHFDVDDYGALPRTFKVGDFPPRYFEDMMRHNSYIWVPSSCNEQIIDNMKFGAPVHLFLDKEKARQSLSPTPYSFFEIHGMKVHIIADSETFTGLEEADTVKFCSYKNAIRLKDVTSKHVGFFHTIDVLEYGEKAGDLRNREYTIFLNIA